MEEMRKGSRVKRSFSSSELGFNNKSKVFVNLSLPREMRQLWVEVRSFNQRRNKYACITSPRKIFHRKDEGQPAVLSFITEVDDRIDFKEHEYNVELSSYFTQYLLIYFIPTVQYR